MANENMKVELAERDIFTQVQLPPAKSRKNLFHVPVTKSTTIFNIKLSLIFIFKSYIYTDMLVL